MKQVRKERKPLVKGEIFGRLSVVERVGDIAYGTKGKTQPLILCQCECGTLLTVRKFALTNGNTKSCGCLRVDVTGDKNKTHGMSGSHLHWVWKGMIGRCTNPHNKAYDRYGGRGITVSDEWRNSFERFAEDMGDRPNGYTLERIDNNLGYCKENCKWASRGEQCFNRRRQKSNTSGRTGVSFKKKSGKWYAHISYNKKSKESGLCETFEEAVKRREEFEMEFYGRILDEKVNNEDNLSN